MNMNWFSWSLFWDVSARVSKRMMSLLGWLYLARVSVVGLAVLFALPLGARGGLRTLAIGAFDVHLKTGAWAIGTLLPFVAWAVFITAAIAFAYGARRSGFEVQAPPEWLIPAWRYAVWAAVAVNVWTIFGATAREGRWAMMGFMALGFWPGFLLVTVIEEWHRQKGPAWLGRNLCLFPIKGQVVTMASVMSTHQQVSAADPREWLLRGYREKTPGGLWHTLPGQGLMGGGIIVFFVLNVGIYGLSYRNLGEMTALVYLLVLLITAVLAGGAASFFLDAYRIPFLSVCIVWLIVASQKENSDHYYRIWKRDSGNLLSQEVLRPAQVLSRAVDKKRPVVLVAIAGGGIQSAAWGVQVLTGLEQLSLDLRQPGKLGPGFPDFAGCVQCISGVSGGSTGAMFFTAGYGTDGLPGPRQDLTPNAKVDAKFLKGIVDAAEETSLGQSVWGFTYPDLRRAWVPFFIGNDYLDRSQRMERKWATNAEDPPEKPGTRMGKFGKELETVSLARWQSDVAEGIRPATIFNGTLVETGERISFSTAPVRTLYGGQREFAGDGLELHGKSDPQLYPGADLRITTAARLSATFPFISSAARALLVETKATHMDTIDNPRGMLKVPKEYEKLVPGKNGLLHVVDGGYYENTGLGALAQWLDNGLTELAAPPKPVGNDPAKPARPEDRKWPESILILQLEAFPESEPEEPGEPKMQDASGRGTMFQGASPLVALYNVRSAGHTASATRLIEVLRTRWQLTAGCKEADTPAERHVCDIKLVRFTIPKMDRGIAKRGLWEPAWADAKPDHPPLSWHLRNVEKDEIAAAWQDFCKESLNVSGSKARDAESRPSGKMATDNPGADPVDKVLDFLNPAKNNLGNTRGQP